MTQPPFDPNSTTSLAKAALKDKGVPDDHIERKFGTTKMWLLWALGFASAALVLLGLAGVVVAKSVLAGGSPSIPVLIVLTGPGILAALAVLFCATQADSEVTRAVLQNLPLLRKFTGGGDA